MGVTGEDGMDVADTNAGMVPALELCRLVCSAQIAR